MLLSQDVVKEEWERRVGYDRNLMQPNERSGSTQEKKRVFLVTEKAKHSYFLQQQQF
jgi:hypothetical protein